MRALVTGSSGFIGTHLVKYLKRCQYYVKGVDIKQPEFQFEKKFRADEFQQLDLRIERNCRQATGGQFDEVYHLAANMGGIGFIESHRAEIVRDNTLIDLNMLEASLVNKAKKFFFSSSACVYPSYRQDLTNIEPLSEDLAYPADAEDGYGWGKLFTEILCRLYREDFGLQTYVARFHNIYGPYGTYKDGREKAPAALCRKIALADKEIEVWGDGKQTRSFCYVDDCVEGIQRLMHTNFHEPLNIGSDRLINIDELINIISKIAGKKVTKNYDTTKPKGVRGRNSDNTLCKKVLGWTPKISLEEGLKETYHWIQSSLGKK